MPERLNLNTREELRAKIEATVAAIQARATDLTAEAIAAEVQADAEELGARGVLIGLSAALGANMGAAVFADLTGRADVSDAELARRFGVTRAAVSKKMIQVRRNLGLPPRVPNNANGPLSRTLAKMKGPSAN